MTENSMLKNPENKSTNTYWFYKWTLRSRILLCIFLLPIFIPILVWPKLNIPLWSKIIVLFVWTGIMLSVFGSSPTKENKDIVLNVIGISENETIKDNKLNIKLKTDPLTVDEITINGESALKKNWDVEYSLEKTYPEGENKISIVAKKGNQKTEKVFSFKVDLTEKKKMEIEKKTEIPKPETPKITTQVEKKNDNVPTEYKSALDKATSYANNLKMSKKGVYNQLVSSYGEKFSDIAAQYGIDNVKADWNTNALFKAKNYQNSAKMSPAAIRDQLVSEYGEQFTPEEADYAMENLNK